MPLNEKAALGGAANLETSSQGSLDNPPYKPAQRLAMGDPTHLWNAHSIGFGGRCRRGRVDERA